MNMPLVLLNRRRRGTGFNPASLFGLNEPGVWYDPSDVANLTWRRNLLTWTEQFDNAVWEKSGTAVITANQDGVADLFRCGATAASEVRRVNLPFAAASYTFSVFAKPEFSDWVVIQIFDATTTSFQRSWFNIRTGVVGSTTSGGSNVSFVSASMTLDTDGYYRCKISATLGALTAAGRVSIFVSEGDGVFTGTASSGILIWGAQLELGSTASDYQRITDVNTEVIERFPTATLYQDTAGTIPVTTPGQAVALMLDKSKGLVLGPEAVTNGGFATDTNWTKGTGWTISGGSANLNTAGGFTSLSQVCLTVGRWYQVSITMSYVSGFGLRLDLGSDNQIFNGLSWNGTRTFVGRATATNLLLANGLSGATNFSIDNISVRELPGNHATQATAASRPIYGIVPQGGRRNLLTWTEVITEQAGVRATLLNNQGVSPNGENTAGTVTETVTTGDHRVDFDAVPVVSGTQYTLSFYIKPNGRNWVRINLGSAGFGTQYANFNVSAGTVGTTVGVSGTTIEAAANGFYRVSLTSTATATASAANTLQLGTADNTISYTGDGTSGIFIWGAQLEQSATATPYQRVTTQYDVTEANVPSCSYLFFDGGSDSMATGNINFTATDKMTVWAGVRKNSDAAGGIVAELSASANVNNGAVYLAAPDGAVPRYAAQSRGTSTASVVSPSSYAAPITNVLASIGDISGDNSALRINGTQVAQSTADQGTGNYGNYPLYIGARAGTSLFFNGNLFGLVVRGAASTTAQITATEAWLAPKTGVVLP